MNKAIKEIWKHSKYVLGTFFEKQQLFKKANAAILLYMVCTK